MKVRLSVLSMIVLFLVFFLAGCGSFWKGAGAGVVGTGAAYEINTKIQLDRLEEDYKAGRISKEEYEIRRDQIKKGSLIY